MTLEMIGTRREQAAARHFARSTAYRLLSQATMYPSDDVITMLRGEDLLQAEAAAEILEETFSTPLAAFAKELQNSSPGDLQREHGRIFSHLLSLDCPPSETVYTAREIFEETAELSDIAGFFRAFGLERHVGHLRNHVFAHASEYQQVHAVAHFRARESAPE